MIPEPARGCDIVVVGASAGGVEALRTLVEALPADVEAAVFVVLHIPPTETSVLPDILRRAGPLPADHANDGDPIEVGRIYVARPDFHLMLERGHVRLFRGPRENGHRPAVDPLFRSAALAYGPRVVGIVLSGTLDDGSAGLRDVKARGGVAVVQDPDEALYRGMPESALAYAGPDHCLGVAAIGELVARLAAEGNPHLSNKETTTMDANLAFESIEAAVAELGPPTALTCPECGGAIWEQTEEGLTRFRCHVGHTFSGSSILELQASDLERSLWTAVSALRERASTARRIARRLGGSSRSRSARRLEDEAQRAEADANSIRNVISRLGAPESESGQASATGTERR